MKIDSSLKNPLTGTAGSQRAQGAAGNGAGKASAPASSGSHAVAISPAAIQLSNLQNGDSDVNVDRVNAIRAAIASGDLKIDVSRIADGLIASARDLLK